MRESCHSYCAHALSSIWRRARRGVAVSDRSRWRFGLTISFVLILALMQVRPDMATSPAEAAPAALPSLPPGWPGTLQVGLADAPGGAAAMKATAPYGFRYQYLA